MRKQHNVFYGTKGCFHTWQDSFPDEAKCVHCGRGDARLAFVYLETGGEDWIEKEFVSKLHDNDPDGEGFWLHDAGAFATYLCRDIKCTGATTLYNQA